MWFSLVLLQGFIETYKMVGWRRTVRYVWEIIAWQGKYNTWTMNKADFTGLQGSLLQLCPVLCSFHTVSVQQQCPGKEMLMMQGAVAALFWSVSWESTCLIITGVRKLVNAASGFMQLSLIVFCHWRSLPTSAAGERVGSASDPWENSWDWHFLWEGCFPSDEWAVLTLLEAYPSLGTRLWVCRTASRISALP